MNIIDRFGRWIVIAAFALVFIHVAIYLAGLSPEEFLDRAGRLVRLAEASFR